MKNNRKGFTLAELLIVIAIIAILVAIAIPTFSGATAKAKLAADEANLRAAYAEATVNMLADKNAKEAGTATSIAMQSDDGVAVPVQTGSGIGSYTIGSTGEVVTVTVNTSGMASYSAN